MATNHEHPINIDQRFDHLERMLSENRVLRGFWTNGKKADEGFEKACLLAALAPEVMVPGEDEYHESFYPEIGLCPAEVMPVWFAELTPSMDDLGSGEEWRSFANRYAKTIRLAAKTLGEEGWAKAESRAQAAILRLVRPNLFPHRLPVVDRILQILDRAAEGLVTETESEEWDELRQATRVKVTQGSAHMHALGAANNAAFFEITESAKYAANSIVAAQDCLGFYEKCDVTDVNLAEMRDKAWTEAGEKAWDKINDIVLSAIEYECAQVAAPCV